MPPRENTIAPLSTWMSPRTFVSALSPSVTLTPSFRASVTELAVSAVTLPLSTTNEFAVPFALMRLTSA